MNPLLWVFEFVFRCRHRELSRVFTIKGRSYQVCFKAAASSSVRNLQPFDRGTGPFDVSTCSDLKADVRQFSLTRLSA